MHHVQVLLVTHAEIQPHDSSRALDRPLTNKLAPNICLFRHVRICYIRWRQIIIKQLR